VGPLIKRMNEITNKFILPIAPIPMRDGAQGSW
jgi:hypothetical protein